MNEPLIPDELWSLWNETADCWCEAHGGMEMYTSLKDARLAVKYFRLYNVKLRPVKIKGKDTP